MFYSQRRTYLGDPPEFSAKLGPTAKVGLKVGATADVAVFELREAPWEMVDSMGEKRPGKWRLRPMATVKGGRVYGNSVIPVYH